jgi:hypothetical protein
MRGTTSSSDLKGPPLQGTSQRSKYNIGRQTSSDVVKCLQGRHTLPGYVRLTTVYFEPMPLDLHAKGSVPARNIQIEPNLTKQKCEFVCYRQVQTLWRADPMACFVYLMLNAVLVNFGWRNTVSWTTQKVKWGLAGRLGPFLTNYVAQNFYLHFRSKVISQGVNHSLFTSSLLPRSNL